MVMNALITEAYLLKLTIFSSCAARLLNQADGCGGSQDAEPDFVPLNKLCTDFPHAGRGKQDHQQPAGADDRHHQQHQGHRAEIHAPDHSAP